MFHPQIIHVRHLQPLLRQCPQLPLLFIGSCRVNRRMREGKGENSRHDVYFWDHEGRVLDENPGLMEGWKRGQLMHGAMLTATSHLAR